MGITTNIGFPNKLNKNQPWGHILNGDSLELFAPENAYEIPFLLKPAGDLSMTPLDFAKYIQVQLDGLLQGNKFLPKEIYQKIHFGYEGFSIGVANGKLSGYKFSGMDGSAGTFFCRAIIIPETEFAFTIMTNVGSGSSEMEAIDWIMMKILKKQFNWWWKFWL